LSELLFALAARLLKINFNQNKMPKVTDQYNLSVMNPALAKEWHPSRNGDLNPRNVTPGSGKKVWWICISGHEWQAPVYSRNRGSGCPVCNKPTVADNNERLITSSDLRKEWHLTRNSGLNLRNLPPDFSEKVWWICEEGHEWQATVKSRTRGRGCPDCNKDLNSKDSSRKHKIPLGAQKISVAPDGDSKKSVFSESSAATGFRKNKRFLHRATVILEDTNSGAWSYAQTKDLSNERTDTQPYKSAPKTYRSVVKWCKEVDDDSTSYTFGIGVKFT
jgi:hypothetical protein